MMNNISFVVFICLIVIQSAHTIKDDWKIQKSQKVQTYDHSTGSGRTARSNDMTSCDVTVKDESVTINATQREISCNCSSNINKTWVWLDENCNKLSPKEYSFSNNTITVMTSDENDKKWSIHCMGSVGCAYRITIEDASEPQGVPKGVQGFIIFLVVSTVVLTTMFVVKKYKSHIHLCVRDSFSRGNDDDKEFDAYVSVGKSTSDIKFIQKNITEVLQGEYNYRLLIDDENLLPRLEYSEKVQEKMHKCRRLIVVFTPAYMTNEWCMYCFSEGLRKLLELNMQMIFIVSDITIQRELSSFAALIGHVPKIFVSVLPTTQSIAERQRMIRKIRLLMPPPPHNGSMVRGMREPMLSDAEDIDQRSIGGTEYGGTKYTFGKPAETHKDDMEEIEDTPEMEYDDDDPSSIKVNQYKTRKDFFRITLVDEP